MNGVSNLCIVCINACTSEVDTTHQIQLVQLHFKCNFTRLCRKIGSMQFHASQSLTHDHQLQIFFKTTKYKSTNCNRLKWWPSINLSIDQIWTIFLSVRSFIAHSECFVQNEKKTHTQNMVTKETFFIWFERFDYASHKSGH